MGNPDLKTGLEKKQRQAVAEIVSVLLADTYSLQLKTQYYHWNVTGPYFGPLHELFGKQYELLSAAVDEIAERIRSVGFASPGTYREFTELSNIKEDKTLPDNWQTMLKNLLDAHETVIRYLRDSIGDLQKHGDEASADMFIGRLEEHEKIAWMLRSHLTK
jgi:starvation-inducible DNA-binding protein